MKIFLPKNKYKYLILVIIHVLTTIFIYYFYKQNGGDVNLYWFRKYSIQDFLYYTPFPLGNYFLNYLNLPLVLTQTPIWVGFILYSLVGFFGILLFGKLIRSYLPHKNLNLGILLMFIPSLHIWTSYLGKEAILFPCFVTIFYSLYRKNYKSLPFWLALIILTLVRMHYAFILLVSFTIAFLLFEKIDLRKKAFFTLGFVIISGLLFYGFVSTTFIETFSIERWQEMIAHNQYKLSPTTAYVPLMEYPLPYKLFTFLFRPLPGEINTPIGWLYGFENLAILILIAFGIIAGIKNYKRLNVTTFQGCIIIFSILMTLIFSYTYFNFGLIARTKYTFMPFLLLIMLNLTTKFYPIRNE